MVEEVSEGGSVPNLLVTNAGDARVLFLEGEELRGTKQNRVLNTSVLVAAHSKTGRVDTVMALILEREKPAAPSSKQRASDTAI